jgi:hypothetical protein
VVDNISKLLTMYCDISSAILCAKDLSAQFSKMLIEVGFACVFIGVMSMHAL